MKQKNPRFYTHYRGLFFDYRRAETDFINQHFNNEPWHIKEYWNVVIRLEPKLWDHHEVYYDGHTASTWTFLGVCIGHGYSYESKSVEDWRKEEEQVVS